MPLVCAAIAPHGGEVVAELADDPTLMQQTRTAMQELGRRFHRAAPQTIVILTPHGIVAKGAVTLSGVGWAQGVLGEGRQKISAGFAVDLSFAESILEEGLCRDVPLVPVVTEDTTPFPLDWGALIPLWFTARTLLRPKIVVLAPDRTLPREILIECGVALARAAQKSRKRIALIASCDQGHAQDADGPYGFDPASAQHDALLVEAIRTNDLSRLLSWKDEFLETAKWTDSGKPLS